MLYDANLLSRIEAGLRTGLPAWGIETSAPVSLLTISENATYRVTAGEGRSHVLRVHRPGYHTAEEIRSELAWIEALRRDGVIETPRPIPTLQGRYLTRLDDDEVRRHAVAFEYMTGVAPDTGANLTAWFCRLGSITARLHTHAKAWTRPADFVRKRWTFATILGRDALWGDWRAAAGLDGPSLAVLERVHTQLEAECTAYGESSDRFGLIHCDLRAANLLVEGDRLGVIDFDDCGFCWFAYDFASSVSFIEHEPIIPELMATWMEGYRSVAPLAQEQERALPLFIMLRRMQLTAWLASHAETPTAIDLGANYARGTVDLAERYLAKQR